MSKFDPPIEPYPEELHGGPLDGLTIDVSPVVNELWPGPHHRRECGVREPVYYQRKTDGLFHYEPDYETDYY